MDIVAYDVMGDSWRSWFRPSVVSEIRRGGTRAIVARPHPQRAEPALWTEEENVNVPDAVDRAIAHSAGAAIPGNTFSSRTGD